jgi:hypothetical protein
VKEAGAEAPSDLHVSMITERQSCVTTDTSARSWRHAASSIRWWPWAAAASFCSGSCNDRRRISTSLPSQVGPGTRRPRLYLSHSPWPFGTRREPPAWPRTGSIPARRAARLRPAVRFRDQAGGRTLGSGPRSVARIPADPRAGSGGAWSGGARCRPLANSSRTPCSSSPGASGPSSGCGVVDGHPASSIDPEALLALTAGLAERDPRLRDESLDWCVKHHGYLSRSRLRNVLRRLPASHRTAYDRYAATLSAAGVRGWPAQADPWPFEAHPSPSWPTSADPRWRGSDCERSSA